MPHVICVLKMAPGILDVDWIATSQTAPTKAPSAISACCAILHEKWDVLNKALTNSPQIQFIYYGALAVTQVYQDRDMLKLHLTGLSAEWL